MNLIRRATGLYNKIDMKQPVLLCFSPSKTNQEIQQVKQSTGQYDESVEYALRANREKTHRKVTLVVTNQRPISKSYISLALLIPSASICPTTHTHTHTHTQALFLCLSSITKTTLTRMPPRNQPTNPAEILPSLQSLVQTNAYSAHQKTRTTAARLSAHGHLDAATEVLFEISKSLLKKGEVGSGVDLAVFMINITETKNELFGDIVRSRVTNLIALCPSTANWRKTVVDASINLSTKAPNPSPAGDPLLLQYIGELYYKEKSFVKAEPHLISSGTRDSGKILGAMGFEWCQEGAVDPSPYLLRLVLPHLLLSPPSILPARSTLDTFLSHLLSSNPSFLIERIPFSSTDNGDEILYTTLPVANYLQLLIRSVQRSGSETAKVSWTELGSKYRSWGKPWLRDEHIKEAIQHISANSFKIPSPRGAGGNNMMADLMSSLFGGGM